MKVKEKGERRKVGSLWEKEKSREKGRVKEIKRDSQKEKK